jgi:hypothetical protein
MPKMREINSPATSSERSRAWRVRDIVLASNTIAVARRNEIRSMHARGKDVGYIAIAMRIPVSIVKQVIEKHKPK